MFENKLLFIGLVVLLVSFGLGWIYALIKFSGILEPKKNAKEDKKIYIVTEEDFLDNVWLMSKRSIIYKRLQQKMYFYKYDLENRILFEYHFETKQLTRESYGFSLSTAITNMEKEISTEREMIG